MPSEIRTPDPLLFDFPLPLRAIYSHIGFPVEIVTNSPEVLLAAEESWGKFKTMFPLDPFEIRLGVIPGSTSICPAPPTCRGQHNLVLQVTDSQNFTLSDTQQGFAFGCVTEATVKNRGYFRYHFLEGTSWMLIESRYTTPVHAACVQFDGAGVLLCGDSGAGKSSLAYACARNGWKFLCDDGTCLIRKRGERVVTGNPYQMRFRETATEFFPELKQQPVRPRASGELAIELVTTARRDITLLTECSVDFIIFLNRQTAGTCGLCPLPKQKALRRFERTICWGEEKVRNEHRAALRNLLSAEIFEMRYTSFQSAIEMMESLIQANRHSLDVRLTSENHENA
jgi:hypothetical protein